MTAPLHKPEPIAERPGVYRFRPNAAPSAASIPSAASSSAALNVEDTLWRDLLAGAASLGLARVGVAPAERFEAAGAVFARWLERGYHGDLRFLESPRRDDPRLLLPEAQSVIVAAVAHQRPEPLAPLQALDPQRALGGQSSIASYALGLDYHTVLHSKLLKLGQRLCNSVQREMLGRVCVDTAPLLEREAARRAGLGFTGKSTLQIVPGVGSFVLLGELLVDVALPPSTNPIADGCGQCTRCLDVCPTQAFVGPYVLDARRCISYLTIEFTGSIPRELRPLLGDHVFGCDLCQRVCPYNHSRSAPQVLPEFSPRSKASQADLLYLLKLTSSEYRRLARGTALRRASRGQLQRNAAVALGNVARHSPDLSAVITALADALANNLSALVREHAAWALGRLATPEALTALEAQLAHETDVAVRREILLSLEEARATPQKVELPTRL